MIPRIVTLGFDPETASKEIKAVFADDLARTLWLAVRPGHLVDQHFNANCLYLASVIKGAKEKRPLTAQQLLQILSVSIGYSIIGVGEIDFATDLLPLVNGEETIGFDVSRA